MSYTEERRPQITSTDEREIRPDFENAILCSAKKGVLKELTSSCNDLMTSTSRPRRTSIFYKLGNAPGNVTSLIAHVLTRRLSHYRASQLLLQQENPTYSISNHKELRHDMLSVYQVQVLSARAELRPDKHSVELVGGPQHKGDIWSRTKQIWVVKDAATEPSFQEPCLQCTSKKSSMSVLKCPLNSKPLVLSARAGHICLSVRACEHELLPQAGDEPKETRQNKVFPRLDTGHYNIRVFLPAMCTTITQKFLSVDSFWDGVPVAHEESFVIRHYGVKFILWSLVAWTIPNLWRIHIWNDYEDGFVPCKHARWSNPDSFGVFVMANSLTGNDVHCSSWSSHHESQDIGQRVVNGLIAISGVSVEKMAGKAVGGTGITGVFTR
ncbi:hypothetical protein BCR41DRAFT_387117 [Lobosporangium transversale]|uniref:Uncharacterized protein n=1 Tax=Lobosporangium transversale TaxID=64571 RepID=A0A1Y2GKV8_9FUNG|nr:hypothetical protein BCR41DRAFT_387117 [Lobosporangium transversale]ORZ13903.1 hypothetical protein BCR41DRAFT_387117 [Lobosporangium transversale]|eukprot:XP_021880687.1 hypothetical protein BCR41DRAFT_387117 [Lobosporangium transversale]